MTVRILEGDALAVLKTLPDDSVHCVVTSPPYFGLRDYGVAGQIGLEPTPGEFIERMVAVFREVRRVMRDDGTCWVNMGDSYARNPSKGGSGPGGKNIDYSDSYTEAQRRASGDAGVGRRVVQCKRVGANGIKEKDLIGVPWRLAFALQDDGWYLRQDIIWHKPNPMPESVRDRCTKAHEYVFLLSKSERYYFDAEAISEPCGDNTHARRSQKMPDGWATHAGGHGSFHKDGREKGKTRKLADPGSGTKNNASFDEAMAVMPTTRNKRSVWTITTKGFSEAHFATFPPELPETCIKAGTRPGDTVLDPFFGAGTTGLVADRLGRNCIGIELNPAYADMARRRIAGDAPLFAEVA